MLGPPTDVPLIGSLDGGFVADLVECESRDETNANASLIAAAPDLLEALRRMIAVGQEFYDMEAGEEGGDAIALAEAVIAKAEGKS